MGPESDPLAEYRRFKLTSATEVIRTMYVGHGEDHYRVELSCSLTNDVAPYEVRCFRLQSLGDSAELAYIYVIEFSTSEKTAVAALNWAFSEIRSAKQRADAENPDEPPITKAGFEANLKKASRIKP